MTREEEERYAKSEMYIYQGMGAVARAKYYRERGDEQNARKADEDAVYWKHQLDALDEQKTVS